MLEVTEPVFQVGKPHDQASEPLLAALGEFSPRRLLKRDLEWSSYHWDSGYAHFSDSLQRVAAVAVGGRRRFHGEQR